MKNELKATVIEMRRLGKSEEEIEKSTRSLGKEINKLDRELRDLDKSVGDSFREIGKYEEALESLSSTANTVKGALVGVGTELVAGLLVESITSNREAQLELDKLQNKANATAKVLGDALSESLFDESLADSVLAARDEYLDALGDRRLLKIEESFTFSDEAKAKLKKDQEENEARIKQLSAAFSELNKQELAARESAKNNNEENKSTIEGIKNTIDALDNLSTKALEAEIQNKDLARSLSEQIEIQEKIKAVSDDANRSFDETLKAKTELVKIDKQVAETQEKIAKNEIQIQTLNVGAELLAKNRVTVNEALNLTTEKANQLLKDKNNLLSISEATDEAYTQAYINFVNSRTEASTTALETEEKLGQILSDKYEKDLDILIDGSDKIKSINEQIIADETISNDRRVSLLETTKKLTKESFDTQIQTISKFAKEIIDLNSQISQSEKDTLKEKVKASDIEQLIAIKDSKLLNDRIRELGLSEIFEGRTLEVFKEKIQANQDFVESQKEVNQSLAKTNEINEDILDQEAQLEILRNKEIDTQKELDDALEKLDDERIKNRLEAIELELETVEKGSKKEAELNQEKNDLKLEQETKAVEKRIAIKSKEDEDEKDRIERNKELTAESIQFASDQFNAFQDKKMAALDRELEQGLRNQDIIAQGIENGSKLGEQSLAQEKALQAEREAELKRLEAEALKLNALISLLQVWGDTGSLSETLAGFATIKNTANSVTGFYTGTDSVGSSGSEVKHSDGRDGYIAKLDKGEMVFNSGQSDELRSLGFTTRDSMLDLARMSEMGVNKGGKLVNVVSDNSKVVKELQEQNKLLKQLPKQMPITNRDLSDDPRYIEQVVKTGNIKTKVKTRARGTWNRG